MKFVAACNDSCASRDGHDTAFRQEHRPGDLDKAMLRRLVILLGVLVVAIAFAIVLDGAWRQRIHTQNMARAELVRREFDAHVAAGTSLSVVDEYLQAKTANVTRSTGSR